MGKDRAVTVDEILKHASADDCWIVVDGHVWDLSEFAPQHPGGEHIITRHAGHDASDSYNSIHGPSLLRENLEPSKHIGTLDKSTVTDEWAKPPPKATPELNLGDKPPLQTIISAYDFEDVASRTLTKKTWAFYSSAATDCITRDNNRRLLDRIWFRPRLMRNVRDIDTRSTLLGRNLSMPLFVSPAALAKLVHPDGEKALAQACVNSNIIQAISNNASFPADDIIAKTPKTHPTIFQLYVNRDRSKTEALLKHLLTLRPRICAIMITIDAPIAGKREADERIKSEESITAPNSGQSSGNDKKGGGLGRIMASFIDPSLTWDDIDWIRSIVGDKLPLLIKGVQCAADARLAMEKGVQGIVVSNHGGRSLDTTPPAVLVLLELHKCCPEVFERMEIYVDGGIRRGTDILKCLCLGATAVGIGRHFLYSLNYGQEGAEHLVELLRDELATAMALIGVNNLSEVRPGLVNTGDIDHMVPQHISGHPYASWRPKARM